MESCNYDTATAILTTEKAKNLFYATQAAMMITSRMAYAIMLVTPEIATMMTETASKKTILTAQVTPAATLTTIVIMT